MYAFNAYEFRNINFLSEIVDLINSGADHRVSEYQGADVKVSGNSITGTLMFMEGGLSPAGPLSGDGYPQNTGNAVDANGSGQSKLLIPAAKAVSGQMHNGFATGKECKFPSAAGVRF